MVLVLTVCVKYGKEIFLKTKFDHNAIKVGNKIQKLLKTTSKGNEGVTVERWCEDHHRHYNLKELQRQKKMQMHKYLQDDNMLFDYVNSDLLPMTSKSNGHKRISKATDRSLRSFAQSKKSEIIHL